MTVGDTSSLAPSSALPIAVAGAGIVGLSIALRLAESGWTVEVFDQGLAGAEASWAGAGMLAPGGEVDAPSPLADLAVKSHRLYRPFVDHLERASGIAIDMQEAGALELSYNHAEQLALNRRASVQHELGIESRALSPLQVTTFWPRVRSESLLGARFYPGDAIVNPRHVVSALRIALQQRSVALHENSPVQQAVVAPDHVEVTVGSLTRFYSTLVVAMGAWSSSLPVAGVPPLPFAEPVKGHLIAYHQPEQTCSTIVRSGHTYLLQRASGLLLVGASVEKVGFDRSIDPAVVADLERQAGLVFPHLAETSPTEVWIGFRPGAESLHLGPWHSPRLQLAYGHYRNGILLAPVTAEKIAAHINASSEKR